jgi:hypothetical protein
MIGRGMSSKVNEEVSFSRDMAGKRVGRVSAEEFEHPTIGPSLFVNVVTATVGNDGASFEHRVDTTSDGEMGRSYPVQKGFLGVVAMSALFLHEPPEFRIAHEEPERAYRKTELLEGGIDLGRFGEEVPDFDWVGNGAGLIATLRGKIEDTRFAERYPEVYYWLNGSIARFDDEQKSLDGLKIKDLLMPDKSMHRQTEEQYEITNSIAEALVRAKGDDRMMLRMLAKAFPDIPVIGSDEELVQGQRLATEASRRFEENRRFAAASVKEVNILKGRLIVPGLVNPPAGLRVNVGAKLSWPSMDPKIEGNDARSFGYVLDAVNVGNPKPAVSELGREIAELEARIQAAEKGTRRFGELSIAETE